MILPPRLRCRDGRSQWLRREAAAPSRRKPRSRRAEGVAEKEEEEAAMTG